MENTEKHLLLAKNLILECKKKGITLTSLARLSGISQPTLHGWSTGRSVKKIEDLVRVCNVLEVSLYEILFGIVDPHNKPSDILHEVYFDEIQVIVKRINKGKEQ